MAKPYIATEKITIGTALAFVPGDEVPDDTVERLGLHASVARQGSKSAEDATRKAVESTTEPATGISDQLP